MSIRQVICIVNREENLNFATNVPTAQATERAKDVIESSDINFDLFRRTRGLKN